MTLFETRAVREASDAVSASGRFAFTPRNLYYELLRRGVLPEPSNDPRGALVEFRRNLLEWESREGKLDGLIRAANSRARPPLQESLEVLDYSVRRVLVFDRVETCLLFAMNGFHRRVEVALLAQAGSAEPGFPAHVARRIAQQARGGLSTALYLVHDANLRGARLGDRTRQAFGAGPIRIADAGLTFAQAFKIGIPARQALRETRATPGLGPEALEPTQMLAAGYYAHLEELRPLDLLRWAYDRVSRGAEEHGFG